MNIENVPGVLRVASAAAPAPVVFDSPHSGLECPADFGTSASRAAILSTWDAYVDELFGGAPAAGATLLAALFPRAYIDTNRAPDDIDPELLAAPWPSPLKITDYTRRGMGLIRRDALPGVPMYAARLSVAAVRQRIHRYYDPYRVTLARLLDAAHARHGRVWHFNCHSMKSRGNAMNVDRGAARPDFVISDREGTTAAPALTAWVADFFRARGHRVQLNDPYRGGDLVRAHGDPARRRHSVQIEINRALYLEEASAQRGPGFPALRRTLDEFAHAAVVAVRKGGVP